MTAAESLHTLNGESPGALATSELFTTRTLHPTEGLRGQWSDRLITALSPILDLLSDPRITDIEVNGFDDVWVKGTTWSGHTHAVGYGWQEKEDLLNACIRVSEVINRPLSQKSPLLNARLPGGERVNIAIPPACDRIALTIRKFPADAMTLDRLLALGSINPQIAQICQAAVLARKSILVAGSTGSGKTSLLNALARVIPETQRIVTIEDARELTVVQPNVVYMETVEPFDRNVAAIPMGTLVTNSLRQGPDRIIVGEVRDEAAFSLLRAFCTGHSGGLGTIHASSASDALSMLQLLAQMAPIQGLTPQNVAQLVARAIDIVIFQRQFEEEGGIRRIAEIIELNKPGATIGPGGEVTYHARTIAKWEGEAWHFPDEPSQSLKRAIEHWGPVLQPPEAIGTTDDIEINIDEAPLFEEPHLVADAVGNDDVTCPGTPDPTLMGAV